MRLLALWLLALWSTAFGQPSETVLEPKSKIAFPSEIKAPVVPGSRPQVLLDAVRGRPVASFPSF